MPGLTDAIEGIASRREPHPLYHNTSAWDGGVVEMDSDSHPLEEIRGNQTLLGICGGGFLLLLLRRGLIRLLV